MCACVYVCVGATRGQVKGGYPLICTRLVTSRSACRPVPHLFSKEPCILSKELSILSKEISTVAKEPCILIKESWNLSKKCCILSKVFCVPAKSLAFLHSIFNDSFFLSPGTPYFLKTALYSHGKNACVPQKSLVLYNSIIRVVLSVAWYPITWQNSLVFSKTALCSQTRLFEWFYLSPAIP